MFPLEYLPNRSPSDDATLRRALVRFREDVLVIRHPIACREGGLLRRAMIDELIKWRPKTPGEFYALCDLQKIKATDPAQIRSSLLDVLNVVESHSGG